MRARFWIGCIVGLLVLYAAMMFVSLGMQRRTPANTDAGREAAVLWPTEESVSWPRLEPAPSEAELPGGTKILRHTLVHYPPFLLLPEIPLRGPSEVLLLKVNGILYRWYTEQSGCNESIPICQRPQEFARSFGAPYDPELYSPLVGFPEPNVAVFHHPRLMTSHIHVLSSMEIPVWFHCGQKEDQVDQVLSFKPPLRLFHVGSAREMPNPPRVLELDGPLFFGAVEMTEQFQHFVLDGLAKFVQGYELYQDPKVYVAVLHSPRTSPLLFQILERLHVNLSRVINTLPLMEEKRITRIRAPEIRLSCQAPIIHPLLWQRARTLLGFPKPFDEKPLLIYLARRNYHTMLNGERSVHNEAKLLAATRAYFEPHYRLVVFDSSDYLQLDALLDLYGQAALIFGPHGGAFCNVLFAPASTVVLEFFPAAPSFWLGVFRHYWWWVPSMIGQRYSKIYSMKGWGNSILLNISEVVAAYDTLRRFFPLLPAKGVVDSTGSTGER